MVQEEQQDNATYISKPRKLGHLEMPSEFCPQNAPPKCTYVTGPSSPLDKNKAKSKTRGDNTLKYFKGSPTFLRLSLDWAGKL